MPPTVKPTDNFGGSVNVSQFHAAITSAAGECHRALAEKTDRAGQSQPTDLERLASLHARVTDLWLAIQAGEDAKSKRMRDFPARAEALADLIIEALAWANHAGLPVYQCIPEKIAYHDRDWH